MFCKISTCEDGVLRTYVGHVESWDATTVRLLLTEPFALAGRFVDLDMAQVVEHLVLAAPPWPSAGPLRR